MESIKLKKINELIWKIEKTGKMNVPVIIYASKVLLEKMKEDKTLEQAKNVSMLPGILKASYALSDSHEGYGFPIGGVAAFDMKEGIISPGGVGYDINCLSGDSNILMGDGSLEHIKNITTKDKVFVYKNGDLKKAHILLTLKKIDNVFKITTKKGFEIKSTLDHPFLTQDGMIPLKFINLRKKIAYYDEELKWDKIKSIKQIGIDKVYDLNVNNENHNFIANGFIVSNCSVRLLRTNLFEKEIQNKRKQLLDAIFREVPAGVGKGGVTKLSREEIKNVLEQGAMWAVKQGYGTKQDAERTEEQGCMKANFKYVSQRAIARGLPQLGTLGAGNHFLEIQKVDKIYDKEIAKAFGIDKEGQITVMIHCGSRGLGHQVASDYIKEMEDKYGWQNLPDRELINAPISSELGKKYFGAMSAAANFAFANKQMITHWVREVFKKIVGTSEGMEVVYDVCHNIAKFEEHKVDGKKIKVCVHRKGATRSFGPGRNEIPSCYRKIGQPVIIPGSMGTASYLLVGTKKAEEISFGSTAHGSGRVSSRSFALKTLRGEQIKKELNEKGIEVKSTSWKSLAEEAPQVYKDIDEVVRVSHELGIGNLVARVVPLAVMKG